ncbi:MAG: hypothetical protein QXP34_03820 [Candidatus Aenigmatarchaeota archaeon]
MKDAICKIITYKINQYFARRFKVDLFQQLPFNTSSTGQTLLLLN